MKISIEIEVMPFTVPGYVLLVGSPQLKQAGFIETPKLPLSELDSVTLSRMCDDFRKEVFIKAGITQP